MEDQRTTKDDDLSGKSVKAKDSNGTNVTRHECALVTLTELLEFKLR